MTLKRRTTTTERPQGDARFFDQGCRGKPADIYFLLDASSSVWVYHFDQRVLPFVRDLVSAFQISPIHTRVGVVTFSNKVNHEFGLSEHSNLQSLLEAIQPDEIDYLTGGTNTGDAIRYVTENGFHQNNARDGVAKIIVTVTDGLSQRPRKTAEAAAEARHRGVTMFAVGVGKYVDNQELMDISSNPDEDYTFFVDDFDALDTITDKLALQTCNAVSQAAIKTSDTDSMCKEQPSSVEFVYDSEYQTKAITRTVMRQFVSPFSQEAAVLASNTRVGVLTQPCASASAGTGFTYLREMSLSSLEQGTTTVAGLIRTLRTQQFSSTFGKKIVVLLLDENSMKSDLQTLMQEVTRFGKDVRVVVVAVGAVPEHVVRSVASSPVADNVIRIDSYNNLKASTIDTFSLLCWNGPVKIDSSKIKVTDTYVKMVPKTRIATPTSTGRPGLSGHSLKPGSPVTTVRVTKVVAYQDDDSSSAIKTDVVKTDTREMPKLRRASSTTKVFSTTAQPQSYESTNSESETSATTGSVSRATSQGDTSTQVELKESMVGETSSTATPWTGTDNAKVTHQATESTESDMDDGYSSASSTDGDQDLDNAEDDEDDDEINADDEEPEEDSASEENSEGDSTEDGDEDNADGETEESDDNTDDANEDNGDDTNDDNDNNTNDDNDDNTNDDNDDNTNDDNDDNTNDDNEDNTNDDNDIDNNTNDDNADNTRYVNGDNNGNISNNDDSTNDDNGDDTNEGNENDTNEVNGDDNGDTSYSGDDNDDEDSKDRMYNDQPNPSPRKASLAEILRGTATKKATEPRPTVKSSIASENFPSLIFHAV